jgi:hypothetical protein
MSDPESDQKAEDLVVCLTDPKTPDSVRILTLNEILNDWILSRG